MLFKWLFLSLFSKLYITSTFYGRLVLSLLIINYMFYKKFYEEYSLVYLANNIALLPTAAFEFMYY